MRRVEVMPLFEHLELEVREDPAEPHGDLAELVGVAQPAESEVDGPIEGCQRIAVEVVRPKRLHERSDPAGPLRHPGRRLPRRRWRWPDPRPQVKSDELAHHLVPGERLDLVVLAPERQLRRALIPAPRPGRLQQGEARQPLLMVGGDRQRRRTTTGIADQMELLPPARIRLAQNAGDLQIQCVVGRSLIRHVDLQLFRHHIGVRTERGHERWVRELGRKHGARKHDHPKRCHSRTLPRPRSSSKPEA